MLVLPVILLTAMMNTHTDGSSYLTTQPSLNNQRSLIYIRRSKKDNSAYSHRSFFPRLVPCSIVSCHGKADSDRAVVYRLSSNWWASRNTLCLVAIGTSQRAACPCKASPWPWPIWHQQWGDTRWLPWQQEPLSTRDSASGVSTSARHGLC